MRGPRATSQLYGHQRDLSMMGPRCLDTYLTPTKLIDGGWGGVRLLAGKYIAKEQISSGDDISVVTAIFDAFWLEQLTTAALLQVSRSCLHQLALAPDTCCFLSKTRAALLSGWTHQDVR